MIFFLVDYFGPILGNIDVRGGAPFFSKHSQNSDTFWQWSMVVHLFMEKNWFHLFFRDKHKCTWQ